MASDNQAGWEWQHDDEHYYSQLTQEDLALMPQPDNMPAKPSYRMSFEQLIAELTAHKQGN